MFVLFILRIFWFHKNITINFYEISIKKKNVVIQMKYFNIEIIYCQ